METIYKTIEKHKKYLRQISAERKILREEEPYKIIRKK